MLKTKNKTTEAPRPQGYTHNKVVNSSVIDEVIYDADSSRLFVKLNSGSIAAYEGVNQGAYDTLIDADSPGQYWNRYIKNNRNFRKINGNVALFMRAEPAIEQPTVFSPSAFTPVEFTKGVISAPGVLQSPSTQPNRVFLVTVAVEAPSLAVAVNDVASQGLEVTAVNPAG